MRKDVALELWQLKTALTGLINQLSQETDHLDTLTCRLTARALDELLQEIIHLPNSATGTEIEQFAIATLIGTRDIQHELAARWFDELQPIMHRAQERAAQLNHDLADFTCLSVDGQEWGAVCIKCLEWVFVRPNQASGSLTTPCKGWAISGS